MSSWRRYAVLIAVAAAGFLVGTLPAAQAHTALVSITPAPGAVLQAPPTEVQLTFNEAVQPNLSVITVTSASGTSVTVGKPSSSGTEVTQALAGVLAPGTYTIAWKVVADDGHPVSDTSTFEVAGQANATASSTTAPSEPASPTVTDEPTVSTPAATGPTATGAWRLIGLALVLGSLVVVTRGWARRYRQTHRE